MNTLQNLDKFLTRFINGGIPHNQFFESLFSFFSLQGGSIFIWLLVIIFIVIIEEIQHPGIQKTDRKFILYSLFVFGISYVINELVFKNIFQRMRPDDLISINCPADFSFPSTHAVTAFAAATIIGNFDKKRAWLYYLVAFFIALSRIYLGCHYLFDVITGSLIGFLLAKIILKLKI